MKKFFLVNFCHFVNDTLFAFLVSSDKIANIMTKFDIQSYSFSGGPINGQKKMCMCL